MKRLTTDTPNGNFETVMNFVYGKDGWAHIRHDGEHEDVKLTDWAKQQCLLHGCYVDAEDWPEDIDQRICECMMDEPGCPIAMAYCFASQAVHLRSRLKMYEDAMPLERAQELEQAEKGERLVVLPDAKYTDADGEKALRKAMWICGNTNNPVTRYTADAIAEKLCREARDESLPLTLEQLREMDGMPVWIVEGSCAHYVLITDIMEDGLWVICREDESKMLFTDYSKTWIAYRQKKDN